MKTHQKGFTLLEALVVVLVLAVLAGVAVPKFKRVLETQKTREAEEVLMAVRTEQEKRCTMGKPYLTNVQDMPVLASAKNSGNFNFSLNSAGMIAQSKTLPYAISMPSYKKGQMCCSGDYCADLNKNYVDCSTLEPEDDECVAEDPGCTLQCPARFTLNEETCSCECNITNCPSGSSLNPLTCICQKDIIPDDDDEDCTFGAWMGVSTNGTTTCNSTNPTAGCVEYKKCVSGSEDFPCGAGASATTKVENKTDNCGSGFSECRPLSAGTGGSCLATPEAAFMEEQRCTGSQYKRTCPGSSTVASVICQSFSGTCILSAESQCAQGDGFCVGLVRTCDPMEYGGNPGSGCLKQCTCTPKPATVTYVVCESGDGGYPYYKRTCSAGLGPTIPFPRD